MKTAPTQRTFSNPKHGTITTDWTDKYAKDIIEQMVDLTKNDFARSLVHQYPRLSEKQLFWLHKIALEVAGVVKRPQVLKESIGDFNRLQVMFKRAAAALLRPKITLMDDEGHQLVLSLAPATGANAGCLYVKDEERQYLGKVNPQGEFFPRPAEDFKYFVLGTLHVFRRY